MEHEAGAEFKTVVAGRVELRPQVAGFEAEGYEWFEGNVNATAKLKGEAVSATGRLWENGDSADKRVDPRLPTSLAPGQVRTHGVSRQERRFIIKRGSAQSHHEASVAS